MKIKLQEIVGDIFIKIGNSRQYLRLRTDILEGKQSLGFPEVITFCSHISLSCLVTSTLPDDCVTQKLLIHHEQIIIKNATQLFREKMATIHEHCLPNRVPRS